MHSGSPHIQALEHSSPGLKPIPEPAEDVPPSPLLPKQYSKPEPAILPTSTPAKTPQSRKTRIAELRVDTFLGEWLSPDYFENITPPPGSVMMVASAKADLLRPGEIIEGSNPGKTSHGNFPGGWSIDWSPASSGDELEEKTGLANMASLGHSLPNRTRSSTHGTDSSNSYFSRRQPTRLNTKSNIPDANTDVAYVPPTPTYAISSSDPIPVGYVAHARDACISVSYAWDSMRAPQFWGNGGEYGEEWSSMHRRFRNGLSKMIEWYEEHGTAINRTVEMFVDPTEEEETDTVVILVTHGAGCNALLGALTNQPVLLDVGMASLTMAVRKEGAKSAEERRRESGDVNSGGGTTSSSQRRNGRRASLNLGISEDYEMKFTASTDHLRAGSNPLASSSVSPRIGPAGTNSPYRRPTSSFSGDNFTIGEGVSSISAAGPSSSRPLTAGAAASAPSGSGAGAGLLHRSISNHSALRGMYHPATSKAPRVSSGLWRSGMKTTSRSSSNSNSNNEGASESGAESDALPNFGGNAVAATTAGTRVGKGMGLDGADEIGSLDTGGRDFVVPEVSFEDGGQKKKHAVNGTGTPPRHGNGNENGIMNANANANPEPTSTRAATPSDLMRKPGHSHTPTRTASHQRGLWGGGGGGGGGVEREMLDGTNMPKRRWTVLENTAA
jgi:hypothetical protein